MSRTRVTINGFSEAVMDALEETRGRTETALIAAIDKTTKKTVSNVKAASPVRTGKYGKGWTSKVTTSAGRGNYGRTVYNSPRYMLAHLLQNGHGGPHPAGAKPHIPQDEETEALFQGYMESEMRKG